MRSSDHHSTDAFERGGHVLLVDGSDSFVDRMTSAVARQPVELDLTTVTAPEVALSSLASADCVLVAPLDEWTRTEFVAAVRERDRTLPVVAVVDSDDSDAPDTLLSAGATDVVTPETSDQLLAARLTNVLARQRTTPDEQVDDETSEVTPLTLDDATFGTVGTEPTEASPTASADECTELRRELDATRKSLRELYRVTTDASLSLDERIEKTLVLACERLDVDLGFVTRITAGTQRIVHAVGDHPLLQPGEACPLSESYCRRTLETDGLLAVVHAAADDDWVDDPGYELFGLECYLGGRISVDGDLYGTLCFGDTDPRDEPFTESEVAFVELLTRWVSYELERKARERDLRTATRRFRALFDNPRTCAGILDCDGTLREANHTARTMLEDPESAIGRPFWEAPWWTPGDESVETVRTAVERAAEGETVAFECSYFHCNGKGTVSATIYPVYGATDDEPLAFDDIDEALETTDTEVVSLMAVGTDTTMRTQQAEQLRRQRNRLEEFASVVSHDLRSPLEVARGRLQLYETNGDEQNIQHAMDSIDRMSTLIDDLLQLARQGDTVSDPAPTQLSAVARRAWSTVQTDTATLTVDLDRDRTVDADASRLQQLFENLFRNAVEHGSTPDDPERASIRVVGLDSDRCGFAVEDDGSGIDPADRDQVFSRGFTTNEEGTGFGLAIVKRVVEAHGWEIDVTESVRGGARFEITVEP